MPGHITVVGSDPILRVTADPTKVIVYGKPGERLVVEYLTSLDGITTWVASGDLVLIGDSAILSRNQLPDLGPTLFVRVRRP